MLKSRSVAVSVVGAIVFGAALFAAASLSGAGDHGSAGQVRTVVKPTHKLLPVRAVGNIQPLAKALGNPVAFGFVQYDGSIGATSGNFTAEWNPTTGRYYIHIAGVSYQRGPYITFVTAEGNGGIYLPATWEDSGALVIYIGEITGDTGIQAGFQFVTYKVS